MKNRAALLDQFLHASGWGAATLTDLAADASSRSYQLLVDRNNTRTAVLMNAPENIQSNVVQFSWIAGLLEECLFSAPRVYHQDSEHGFLILEYFNGRLFAEICQDNIDLEEELYQTAVDLLVSLHRQTPPPNLPLYDKKTYAREARLLTEWYLPAATGQQTPPDILAEYEVLIEESVSKLTGDQTAMVLRDYHAENLIWLPERAGLKKVGLLDFQDVLCGHPAYDLVSLLEDARRDTSGPLRTKMLEHYIAQSGVPKDAFTLAYNILGAQRNLKIIGIFSRLCLRDGKPAYLDLIPRVWAHLMRDLTHPDLAKLRAWVLRNIPMPSTEIISKIRNERP